MKNKGFSVFLMPAGMLGTLLALWDVVPLFSNTGWGQNSNIAFLESHMGIEFTKRQQPRVLNITAADLKSGDFLAMSKIDLWVGRSRVCGCGAGIRVWRRILGKYVGAGLANRVGGEVVAAGETRRAHRLSLRSSPTGSHSRLERRLQVIMAVATLFRYKVEDTTFVIFSILTYVTV